MGEVDPCHLSEFLATGVKGGPWQLLCVCAIDLDKLAVTRGFTQIPGTVGPTRGIK